MRHALSLRSVGSVLSAVLFFGALLRPVFAARPPHGPTGFGVRSATVAREPRVGAVSSFRVAASS